MSLLERVRTTASTVRESVGSGSSGDAVARPWHTAGLGALAVGLTLLACLLVAVPLWALTSSGGSWGQAVGIGAACWFLATGGSLAADGVTVSVVPVLFWAGAVWVSWRALRRAADDEDRSSLAVAPYVVAGYAAAEALVALVTFAGPARPGWTGLLTALGVPLAALVVEQVRRPEPALADRVPVWLVRAGRPAVWGLAVLGAAGLVLVLVQLVLRWSTVTGIYAALGTGAFATLLLTLLQVLYLPDLLVWGVAVLAGPGFQVSSAGSVTLGGSRPGLLPMVPALGLVPPDGTAPGWAWAALGVPVAAGVLVGWRSTRSWARLADWRSRARTAAAAVVLVALALTVLAAPATGSAGAARLAHLGVAPLVLGAALLGELGLGAACWLAWDTLRRRRLGLVD